MSNWVGRRRACSECVWTLWNLSAPAAAAGLSSATAAVTLLQGWGSDEEGGDDGGLGDAMVRDFHFGGGLFERKQRPAGGEEGAEGELEDGERGQPAKKSKKEVGVLDALRALEWQVEAQPVLLHRLGIEVAAPLRLCAALEVVRCKSRRSTTWVAGPTGQQALQTAVLRLLRRAALSAGDGGDHRQEQGGQGGQGAAEGGGRPGDGAP